MTASSYHYDEKSRWSILLTSYRFLIRIVDRGFDFLPLIFILYALPLVIFCVFNIPLFQSPDEPNHVYRADQISHGGLWGHKADAADAGGWIDPALITVEKQYDGLIFKTNVRLTRDQTLKARQVHWSGQRIFYDFPNTAMYPPWLYAPVVVGIFFGKIVNMSVVTTLYLARLFNGLVAIAVSALALASCRRGRLLMFTVLLLPMTLSLFASCSQDALMIALTALAAGVISRLASAERLAHWWEVMAGAGSLLLIAMARPPYVGLFLALLRYRPVLSDHCRRLWPTRTSIAVVLSVLTILAAWIVWVMVTVQISIQREVPLSAKGQIRYIFDHPGNIISIIHNTYNVMFINYVNEFVGVLGWLDTSMPDSYYKVAIFVLCLVMITEFFSKNSESSWMITILTLLGVSFSIVVIFSIQYLTWTPVGKDIIDGVQGRYFIPLALCLGAVLPYFFRITILEWAGRATAIVFPVITMIYLPRVIIERYYLA